MVSGSRRSGKSWNGPVIAIDAGDKSIGFLLVREAQCLGIPIELFTGEARGKATVNDWQARARSGDVASVVLELLHKHYDPGYLQSMQRNFSQHETARGLSPRNRSVAAMAELAQQLLAEA